MSLRLPGCGEAQPQHLESLFSPSEYFTTSPLLNPAAIGPVDTVALHSNLGGVSKQPIASPVSSVA
jgi:hypothetical protein